MVPAISNWFKYHFSDPDAVVFCIYLVMIALVISTMGRMLIPVFASAVIAYLLAWIVTFLERLRVPHFLAVITAYLLFLSLLGFIIFGLLPLLWHQLSNLFNELPNMIGRGQEILKYLPEKYPDYISMDQLKQLIISSKGDIARLGQIVLSASLASIPGLIVIMVYLVLVPMLVYFFLMDKQAIVTWLSKYLPKRRRLLGQVWQEVHEQIGNYIRGRVLEIIIVSIICYIIFASLQLQYAMLLSVMVGLSVIVPYIGAVVVTIPVAVIALLQWGWTPHFAYIMLAYGILITIDANLLVPILFSEVVNLHPVAIIMAVLIFGGFWGFWGVFFAIPLASLVKAILNAWPKNNNEESDKQLIPIKE